VSYSPLQVQTAYNLYYDYSIPTNQLNTTKGPK